MSPVTKRRLVFWSPLAILLVAGLAWLFRPQPVAVDLHTVQRGPMRVTIDEDGETRIRDVFVVSAPVSGTKRRIAHKVGDTVEVNKTVIASIVPNEPALLDQRSVTQARAGVEAAQAALELARAEVRRAESELGYAQSELQRIRQLARSGNVSESEQDRAEREMRSRHALLEEAQARLSINEFELERARAALMPPGGVRQERDGFDAVNVYAPVDGRVLRILAESESVVTAGTGLAEIGDPGNLEIVVDLLSSEAVKVEAGQKVEIHDWGGEDTITGVVRRVEPYGFTRISALGIEEQRVNVIIDIESPREQWRSLGHGFRVEARIMLWQSEDVLRIPLAPLFRHGDDWAVFKVVDGTARLQVVQLGRRNGAEARILDGLAEGEHIVLYPGNRVGDGTEIVRRETTPR